MDELCGDCRLFQESPHKHMGSARCIRQGWVDRYYPACGHFVPMPRDKGRKIWGNIFIEEYRGEWLPLRARRR